MPPRPSRQAKQLAVEDAAKKAAKKPAPKDAQPETTYRVVHRVYDQYHPTMFGDNTVGRYASYAKAKAKASAFLREEYGPIDDWQEYTEKEEGDVSRGFEVYALCPDGEEMWVFIEEEGAVEESQRRKTRQAPTQPTYRVIRETRREEALTPDRFHNHRLNVDAPEDYTVGRYPSYAQAKAGARAFVSERYGEADDDDAFEEYEESEKGGVSGGWEIHGVVTEGDEMWVFIEKEDPLDEGSSGAELEGASDDEDDEDDEDEDEGDSEDALEDW
ncbi:hypothetical protein Q8F55_002070 [Vanrija albida]|uniref:Uncharacterized protein n=1 Tax=Vanrija albida TaxID=181172 RepID=A0ABR3Q8Q4_9TREE